MPSGTLVRNVLRMGLDGLTNENLFVGVRFCGALDALMSGYVSSAVCT
jgi:hypothetical protein